MRTLILGATGFVGRALVMMLQARGHEVAALARDPRRAAQTLPSGVDTASFVDDLDLAAAVARADAIVNLAGEPISSARWTRRRKQQLVASRVDVTRRLAAAIGGRARPLPVLVSASATGWYGDRGDELLDERSPPSAGFVPELCQAWEAAALDGPATAMEDVVYFSPPLGGIGRFVVENMLRRIFAYRRGAIHARFDAVRGPATGGTEPAAIAKPDEPS